MVSREFFRERTRENPLLLSYYVRVDKLPDSVFVQFCFFLLVLAFSLAVCVLSLLLSLSACKMPGYKNARPLVEDSIKSGMVCQHCEYLLRDPLQTDAGLRVCKSCGAEIER